MLDVTDTPPDRLSLNARSPHFDAELLRRGIGIRFKGKERTDVEEYSMSEGWIRVAAGPQPRPLRPADDGEAAGEVEAFFHDAQAGADDGTAEEES
jgi:hypothetical protein